MKRIIVGLLAAALAMSGLSGMAPAKTPKVGEPAPDFTVRMPDNTSVKLADLKGQVVLLNFWATWCVPCKRELPTLDSYYRVQAPHGMKAFAVTTEDSVPATSKVMKELAALMAMPLVRGIRGPYAPIGGAIPTNYIIDRTGVVRYAKAGAFDLDDLNRILVPLLSEAPPKS